MRTVRPKPADPRGCGLASHAASIAKNILTTECVVAESPEKEPVGMPGGGMPDMM